MASFSTVIFTSTVLFAFDFYDFLNLNSLEVLQNFKIERKTDDMFLKLYIHVQWLYVQKWLLQIVDVLQKWQKLKEVNLSENGEFTQIKLGSNNQKAKSKK